MPLEKFEIPTPVGEQILQTLKDLLREPVPPFSVLGIDVIIHGGQVQRIETKKEVKIAVPKEVI